MVFHTKDNLFNGNVLNQVVTLNSIKCIVFTLFCYVHLKIL